MSKNNTIKVETTNGPVLGFADTFPAQDRSPASEVLKGEDGGKAPVKKWLAILYGQAERWTRAKDPEPWTEPKECFEFGTSFPQPPSATAMLLYRPINLPMREWQTQSEDSFFVNVFAPGDAEPDEKLPVMVWVFGGSLTTGSTSSYIYDATEYVRHEAAQGRRVIVVTGNYRVNVFGFLASQDLVDTDADGLTGNYGLYDAVKFLQWTQDNIKNFGGDPSNVTVFGESAGAFLISALLVHPAPLFRRAIMQSGSANTMTVRNVSASAPFYENLLSHASVSSTSSSSAESRLEALRKVPTSALGDIKAPPLAAYGLTLESGPKAVYTAHHGKLLKEGKIRKGIEAVIVGHNADEGSLFARLLGLGSEKGFQGFTGMYPEQLRPHIAAFYPPPGPEDDPKEDFLTSPGSRAFAEAVFEVPMEHQADSLAKNGTKVYAYKLEATCKEIADQMGLGCGHAVDLMFLFRAGPAQRAGSEEEKVANAIGNAWTNFAIKGVPTSDWPLWDEKKSFKVWKQDGSEGTLELGPVQPKTKRGLWMGVIEKAIEVSQRKP